MSDTRNMLHTQSDNDDAVTSPSLGATSPTMSFLLTTTAFSPAIAQPVIVTPIPDTTQPVGGGPPPYSATQPSLTYQEHSYGGTLKFGGDISSGLGSDTGGYTHAGGNQTVAMAENDEATGAQEASWYPGVVNDLNAGNAVGATSLFTSGAQSIVVSTESFATSDLSQGYGDLAAGLGWETASAAAAAGAIGAFSSGNILAGIGAAASSIGLAQKGYDDLSTPAARDAESDIIQSVKQIINDYDASGGDGFISDVSSPGGISMGSHSTMIAHAMVSFGGFHPI